MKPGKWVVAKDIKALNHKGHEAELFLSFVYFVVPFFRAFWDKFDFFTGKPHSQVSFPTTSQ